MPKILALALLLASCLHAQEDDRLSAGETVLQGIEALRNGTVEERTGAALLLGKYNDYRAFNALHQALSDPAVRVRRAALGSLLDRQMGNYNLDPARLLELLADPDEEIRRRISYEIGRVATFWRIQRATPSGRPEPLPPDLKAILLGAYRDSDAIVRRNMVQFHYAFNPTLPEDLLLALLDDGDPTVARHALEIAARTLPAEVFVPAVTDLAARAEPPLRREIAQRLARFRTASSAATLRSLTDDPDSSVANEARISLIEIERNASRDNEILTALTSGALPSAQATRLLRLIVMVDRPLARQLLPELLSLADANLRAEAARYLGLLADKLPSPDELAPLFNDTSPEVRRHTIGLLRRFTAELDRATLQALAASTQPQMRLQAAQFATLLPASEQREVLLDLLIDNEPTVRLEALSGMLRGQLEGWDKLAAAALRDPDPEVARACARILLSQPRGKILRLMRDHVEAYPDSPAAEYLRPHLAALNAPTQ